MATRPAKSLFPQRTGWPEVPGFRDAGNNKGYGKLYYIGNGGHSWMSTITGTSAHYLSFGYSWLGPQGNYYRATGLPLRCLQVPLGTPTGPTGRESFG